MELLTGATREAPAASFDSALGWHRGTDVDRLSEREAQVIADRLMRRLSTAALAQISRVRPCRHRRDPRLPREWRSSLQRCRDVLLAKAGKYFSKTDLDAFRQPWSEGSSRSATSSERSPTTA